MNIIWSGPDHNGVYIGHSQVTLGVTFIIAPRHSVGQRAWIAYWIGPMAQAEGDLYCSVPEAKSGVAKEYTTQQ